MLYFLQTIHGNGPWIRTRKISFVGAESPFLSFLRFSFSFLRSIFFSSSLLSSTDYAASLRILLFWTCWNLDYLAEGKKEDKKRKRKIVSANLLIGSSTKVSFQVLSELWLSRFTVYSAGCSINGPFSGMFHAG